MLRHTAQISMADWVAMRLILVFLSVKDVIGSLPPSEKKEGKHWQENDLRRQDKHNVVWPSSLCRGYFIFKYTNIDWSCDHRSSIVPHKTSLCQRHLDKPSTAYQDLAIHTQHVAHPIYPKVQSMFENEPASDRYQSSLSIP